VSDGTIRHEVTVLRAALNWAVREKWISEAPYVEMPPEQPPRDRWLTRDEVSRLLAGCESAHMTLFIILAYHTAARHGAILELTWDRVDLERRLIQYQRPGKRLTKKRRATVPLNQIVHAALVEARSAATTDYVIEFRGKPIKHSIQWAFQRACERAGIEDCTPHILRHTSATHMIMAGVPIQEVARMLGDTVEMVERVYGKHSPDYLRRAADALVSPSTVGKMTRLK
jgi:integrase